MKSTVGILRFLVPMGVIAGLALMASAEAASVRQLERGFARPPAEARPWVYWFWLNGNITREGITADLEAMKRVGIGGALIMEVDQGAPVGAVDFMSVAWRDLFGHAHREARRLGLELNMNNDAGWNGSGGPWIRPEQAMRRVAWSVTQLCGPITLDVFLPHPEESGEHFRDLGVVAIPSGGTNRIESIRAKAAYEVGGVGEFGGGTIPAESVIARDRVVVLDADGSKGGRIRWEMPEGCWTVLRMGHEPTGVENAPAPESGRGLECDKLSREGIEAQFGAMMAKLAADNGVGRGRSRYGLVATHIDSWENGSQNWTARMPEEFRKRRGYDLVPYLPVLTGRVVESLEVSERFLWDMRRTVSDLVLENYAGRMRELAHAHGMRFTVEAYGGPCDAIAYAGRSDEPMGEFWTPSGAIETCKAMASAGHVYGKRIIGAEAFTSGDQERWREHPALLKSHGDRAFCEGINRLVFHRYALQPWTVPERRPGMTMGPWGQHYERTQTWWEWTAGWHEYLARCQFLLRQGLFVADVCHLVPELPPYGPGDHRRDGYDWDEVPAEVVLEGMRVENGRLVLSDGMSYRLLVLPDGASMTPRLLVRLRELVREGATIVGPKPSRSPSLEDYPGCDAEVRRVADELWGWCDGGAVRESVYGKGRVFWGLTPREILARDGVPADFASAQALRYLHRRGPGYDLYFVANLEPHAFTTTCSFRVTGKRAELWWPDTGRREPAAMYSETEGRTHVVIPFEASGSVFVMFRSERGGDDPWVSVERDGQQVFAARPEPMPRLTVVRARYGSVEDPARFREVTAEVQRKVDAGEWVFAVSTLARGGDPAPQRVKALEVVYEVEGRKFELRARDAEKIHLGPRALVGVTVTKARYGVPGDPARSRDVRDRVRRLIEAGETRFVVARMAEGDDPAFLVVKTLEVELEVEGRRRVLTGRDPDVLELAPVVVPAPAPVEARVDAAGSRFLRVREPGRYSWSTASGRRGGVKVDRTPETWPVGGPWTVRFGGNGDTAGPTTVVWSGLRSWAEVEEPAIRYYSGTGVYESAVEVPAEALGRGRRWVLDLGRVEVMARVTVNGRLVGTLWKPPYVVDITRAIRRGSNLLRIEVVNLWPNRLVGDEQLEEDSDRRPDGTLTGWPEWLMAGQPSPTGRLTFTSWRLWKRTDALLPSGLLGPVEVRAEQGAGGW